MLRGDKFSLAIPVNPKTLLCHYLPLRVLLESRWEQCWEGTRCKF